MGSCFVLFCFFSTMRTLVPSLVEVFQNLNHRGVGHSNVEMFTWQFSKFTALSIIKNLLHILINRKAYVLSQTISYSRTFELTRFVVTNHHMIILIYHDCFVNYNSFRTTFNEPFKRERTNNLNWSETCLIVTTITCKIFRLRLSRTLHK